jgi:hypothetical protein
MSDQSLPPYSLKARAARRPRGTGLYDLESAPEEYRPFLEAELKKIEGNATKKFQELPSTASSGSRTRNWASRTCRPRRCRSSSGSTSSPRTPRLRQVAEGTWPQERGILGATDPDEKTTTRTATIWTSASSWSSGSRRRSAPQQQLQRPAAAGAAVRRPSRGGAGGSSRSLPSSSGAGAGRRRQACRLRPRRAVRRRRPRRGVAEGPRAYLRITGGAQRARGVQGDTAPGGDGGRTAQHGTRRDQDLQAASKAARERFRGSSLTPDPRRT